MTLTADGFGKEYIIKGFLKKTPDLELSEEKTLITHSANLVRFLGYDVRIRRDQQVKTKKYGTKQRTLNNSVELIIPLKDKIEKFLLKENILNCNSKLNYFY